MNGWKLKFGKITKKKVSEDEIWSLFNYVFSNVSKKRGTYKFGLIKSLLDNIFNGKVSRYGIYYSYDEIFSRFAENYWNLIVKYKLRQMQKDGKSEYSKIEIIFNNLVKENPVLGLLEFDAISDDKRKRIIKNINNECKKNVIGALYGDFDGIIYSFDLKEEGLYLNNCVYEFMLKYKLELEKLNYYSWAKFLEEINDDNVLIRLLDNLELSTPKRNNLSIYRQILYKEFKENVCLYCGKKINNKFHVDHFIPWSFIRNDKIWNFVLACPKCNENKKNRLPNKEYLYWILERNKKIKLLSNEIVQKDFENYNNKLLEDIWKYAKMGGMKVWN